MSRLDPSALIDTLRERSVSFAPPEPPPGPRALRPGPGAPMPIGPGRGARATPAADPGAPRDDVSGYPIQPGKVQRPPLRDETLARTRLLDWLDVKIHHRVLLVIADAGYGKTTLLSDFSRRTRLRTLWYRMDHEDRDWIAFLSHLVAAGREHDPEFAPIAGSMLREMGPGGPARDDVLEVFLRELPSVAESGAVLILDDFHAADDNADVKAIARELVARGPERLTIVFSSRRLPAVPVARLRSRGELAELGTDDLRFTTSETDRLFRETYGRPLEPDVLADLTRRTEGWAASLQLVQTALRDRSPAEARSFVRGLSGAQSELYDYLAEEVVGDLADAHQDFLMRTSLLQAVDPEQARVVTGLDEGEVQAMIAESERLGLLGRRQERRRPGYRYHPLVRGFLEARLRRDAGDQLARELHRRVARWAETGDWRTACYHYAAAGDGGDLRRVLGVSIESVVGAGEFALAADYLDRFPPAEATAGFEIIRSRFAATSGDLTAAIAYARSALAIEPDSDPSLSNLLAVDFLTGNLVESSSLAERLARSAESDALREVGRASWHVLEATLAGSLTQALSVLTDLVAKNRERGHTHYEGVSLLNSAIIRRAQGDADHALSDAQSAIEALSRSSSGSEVLSAHLVAAWATAHLGHLAEARAMLASAAEMCAPSSKPEFLIEAAELEIWYGEEEHARSLLDELRAYDVNPAFAEVSRLTRAQLALRTRSIADVRRELPDAMPTVPTPEPGHVSRFLALAAHLALLEGSGDARESVARALAFAERQGATLWQHYSQLLLAMTSPAALDAGVQRLGALSPVHLSIAAELVIDRLPDLDPVSFGVVAAEAAARPERWRQSIRRIVTGGGPGHVPAARVLDLVGTRSDVPLLRSIARTSRGSLIDASLGRTLARRLAPRVTIEDLGRLEIWVGDVLVPGTSVRRKVLALLCYLLTRPKFSATRDEVVDALWPDMNPEMALNSVNQTVYFLRRVFEPGYKEDLSAGYVRHDSDVLWLDSELIQSRSHACRELVDELSLDMAPEAVERLSLAYKGRFALDFSYEDWSVSFRDALHVAYLQVIESAVIRDIETGHYERGMRLARRALEVDPDLESLELSLLRLFRITGAHSAAAEQYEHYASYLREELGVEPPPLESL